jgi:hypothetical protein
VAYSRIVWMQSKILSPKKKSQKPKTKKLWAKNVLTLAYVLALFEASFYLLSMLLIDLVILKLSRVTIIVMLIQPS